SPVYSARPKTPAQTATRSLMAVLLMMAPGVIVTHAAVARPRSTPRPALGHPGSGRLEGHRAREGRIDGRRADRGGPAGGHPRRGRFGARRTVDRPPAVAREQADHGRAGPAHERE